VFYFIRVDELNFTEHTVMQVWLKGLAKAARLVRQVFTNKDGSSGILHLVYSDLTYGYDEIIATTQKQGQVEVFHKSLKPNANLAKSPYANRANPKQSCLRCYFQTRMFEPLEQVQPLRTLSQATHQCPSLCL
jgi:hypothetical protein